MRRLFSKPFSWCIVYTVVLALFTTYMMLDTFVIPRININPGIMGPITSVEIPETSILPTTSPDVKYPIITNTSYLDENISIKIETKRYYDTTCYIADIKISNATYLKTAFANRTYGKNIIERTSDMAKRNDAIFAVNGDYYGFRSYGFVLRNGTLYRDTPRNSSNDDALVVYYDGSFEIIEENKSNVYDYYNKGAYQIFTFGPALVNNNKIAVNVNSEVGGHLDSNPRTAIGIIEPLHYVVIVSDGRIEESAGLTLYQLADIFCNEYNCSVAYNLDGGGSSTMWFNGRIVNVTTYDGIHIVERKVSDCVYFGY